MDPRGIKTGHFYDLQARETETIDAWDGTQNPTETNSANVITAYSFDANGDVLQMTADQPAGGSTKNQSTAYIYGVTGNIFSNELIAKIEYPDPTTGSPSTAAANDQSFTYDRQGEKLTFTDQNGTQHGYLYDVLGRLTADKINTLGSGVDGTVMRLGYSFDTAGRPFQQTSYNSVLGGSNHILNQVQDAYNGYGQLTIEYQEHAGPVVTSTSKKVQYGYSQPTGANYSRLTSMTYAGGRVITYGYNTGLDSTISRVSYQADGGTHLDDYTYLGLSTIVQQAHPQTGIDLTYIQQTGEQNVITDGGDRYTGLDRFGRVDDQYWVNPSTPTSPTDRFQSGYDRDSNVLYRNNLVNSSYSELYHFNGVAGNSSYDSLNRITNFARGTLSASGNNGLTLDQITSPSTTNNWTLDALGNWTGTGSQTRTVNAQNEITSMSGYPQGPLYDNDGNMIKDESGNAYTFDAWNRMVVANGTWNNEPLNESFSYDADNRRPGQTNCRNIVVDSYYSDQWQGLEDDTATPNPPCGTTHTISTYVWGLSYVDDMVERDDSTNGRQYVQFDANHDVTALTNSSGGIQQRYIYDPYGTRTVLTSGWGSSSDSFSWVYNYQGGRYDPVTGKINFRSRDLDTVTGTWMERDATFSDGANLYLYLKDSPAGSADPWGDSKGDNRYGLPDAFWDWWEREGKASYGSDINSIDDAKAAYAEWLGLGSPLPGSGKWKKPPRGGKRGRGLIHSKLLNVVGLGVCETGCALAYNNAVKAADKKFDDQLSTVNLRLMTPKEIETAVDATLDAHKYAVLAAATKYLACALSCLCPFPLFFGKGGD